MQSRNKITYKPFIAVNVKHKEFGHEFIDARSSRQLSAVSDSPTTLIFLTGDETYRRVQTPYSTDSHYLLCLNRMYTII